METVCLTWKRGQSDYLWQVTPLNVKVFTSEYNYFQNKAQLDRKWVRAQPMLCLGTLVADCHRLEAIGRVSCSKE